MYLRYRYRGHGSVTALLWLADIFVKVKAFGRVCGQGMDARASSMADIILVESGKWGR